LENCFRHGGCVIEHKERAVNAHGILVGKHDSKISRLKWEGVIEIYVNSSLEWRGVSNLIEVRVHSRAFMDTLMNLQVLYRTENFLTS
jgi:hypothetical protein